MTPEQEAKLVEDMAGASFEAMYVNSPAQTHEEAMQAALAVARPVIRDEVLEEAAESLEYSRFKLSDVSGDFDRHAKLEREAKMELLQEEADKIRAMKGQ